MATKKYHIVLTTVFAAVSMGFVMAPTVRAQTNLKAKLAARPVTPGEISAYKLPAGTQTSGGLLTVAIGEPLYLEVQIDRAVPASDITAVNWDLWFKPGASKAVLAPSPLGANVPVYEPSDRLISQVAGRTLLRPDVEGVYVVSARITTAAGATADVAQTFIAGKYLGSETCSICHSGLMPDKMTPWSKTGHASMLKNGLDGVHGDHYGPGCISCHTVGYGDAQADSGGFGAIAKQLNWAFPAVLKPGNWDALPEPLKSRANIQCENCHGPGSVHVTGAFNLGLAVSNGSGVCGQCHDAPTHHIKTAEWNNSAHAIATREPSGPGRGGCVGCHTGVGFIGRAKGVKTLDTTYSPINCQTCHEPHGQTNPDTNTHLVRLEQVKLADGTTVTNAGAGALCMNCHQSRQNAAQYAATAAPSSRFGPHHGPQADMLEGVNGFNYGQAIPSSPHGSRVEDTCVTCHMQAVDGKSPAFTRAGGHTFKASWSGDDTHQPQQLVAACQKCHGDTVTAFDLRVADYDGDGTIDGVQTEVQHLLDKLSALLPPVGQPKTSLSIDANWTRPQLKAAYNWQFVHDDGSKGVHNTAYAVGLLKASIADLTANK